jgi:lipoprotein LpqH
VASLSAFQADASGGRVSASKDGNTYPISGTASGIAIAIPPATVSKQFQIKIT